MLQAAGNGDLLASLHHGVVLTDGPLLQGRPQQGLVTL